MKAGQWLDRPCYRRQCDRVLGFRFKGRKGGSSPKLNDYDTKGWCYNRGLICWFDLEGNGNLLPGGNNCGHHQQVTSAVSCSIQMCFKFLEDIYLRSLLKMMLLNRAKNDQNCQKFLVSHLYPNKGNTYSFSCSYIWEILGSRYTKT